MGGGWGWGVGRRGPRDLGSWTSLGSDLSDPPPPLPSFPGADSRAILMLPLYRRLQYKAEPFVCHDRDCSTKLNPLFVMTEIVVQS